jgi:hypothetical protein
MELAEEAELVEQVELVLPNREETAAQVERTSLAQ